MLRSESRKMKFAIAVLCILPLAICAPEKRFFLDTLSIFDLDSLKCDIQLMVDVIGSDPSEHACETECHKVLQAGHVLNSGCPLVCKGFQKLVHQFHIRRENSTAPCATKAPAVLG